MATAPSPRAVRARVGGADAEGPPQPGGETSVPEGCFFAAERCLPPSWAAGANGVLADLKVRKRRRSRARGAPSLKLPGLKEPPTHAAAAAFAARLEAEEAAAVAAAASSGGGGGSSGRQCVPSGAHPGGAGQPWAQGQAAAVRKMGAAEWSEAAAEWEDASFPDGTCPFVGWHSQRGDLSRCEPTFGVTSDVSPIIPAAETTDQWTHEFTSGSGGVAAAALAGAGAPGAAKDKEQNSGPHGIPTPLRSRAAASQPRAGGGPRPGAAGGERAHSAGPGGAQQDAATQVGRFSLEGGRPAPTGCDEGADAAGEPRLTAATATEGCTGRARGRRLKSIVRGHGLPPAAGDEVEVEEDGDEAFLREESEAEAELEAAVEGRRVGPPPPSSWGAGAGANASGRSSAASRARSALTTLKYPDRDPYPAEPTSVSLNGGSSTAAQAMRFELDQELSWCRKQWGLFEKDGKPRDMEALMADVLEHVGRKVYHNLQRRLKTTVETAQAADMVNALEERKRDLEGQLRAKEAAVASYCQQEDLAGEDVMEPLPPSTAQAVTEAASALDDLRPRLLALGGTVAACATAPGAVCLPSSSDSPLLSTAAGPDEIDQLRKRLMTAEAWLSQTGAELEGQHRELESRERAAACRGWAFAAGLGASGGDGLACPPAPMTALERLA